MKGVVLAGGLGTRLKPLSNVTNKCLLPVYDRPMIYYPIQTLVDSGIKDVLLVCGGNAAGEFLRILGNGEEFGLKHLHYTYQAEPKGIADALSLAEEFVDGDDMCVMLADNLFEFGFKDVVEDFRNTPCVGEFDGCGYMEKPSKGARIFLTTVERPEWYGVAEIDSFGSVKSIEEKPKNPKSNSIVTGAYLYDSTVWSRIAELSPSARGELEITDLNNMYLKHGLLKAHHVDGFWMDAGESLNVYAETCYKMYLHYKGG